MSYKTRYGQSILDIMLQNKGSIDGLIEFYKDIDNLNDTITDGRDVSIVKEANPVTRFLDGKRLVVSAGSLSEEDEDPGFTDPDGMQAIVNSGVTDPFAQQEIYNLVIRAKAAGTNNWDKYDYFNGLNLGAGNVTDWKGAKTATVNGGVTFDEFGAKGDVSSGYIDLGCQLNEGSFSSSINNQAVGGFFHKVSLGKAKSLFGVNDGVSRTVLDSTIGQGYAWSINTFNREPNSIPYEDKKLEVISRNSSSNSDRIVEGNIVDTSSEVSTSTPTGNIYVLGRNSSGLPDNLTGARVAVFKISESVGFDHAAENEYTTLYVASIASGTSFTDYATAKAWLDAN